MAFFKSKTELLSWANGLLGLNLSAIEQTANGAVACQIMDTIYPNVPLRRVNFAASTWDDQRKNYKVLQQVFATHNIQKEIPIDKLLKAKTQDNLEFMQWLNSLWERSCPNKEGYDAVKRRAEAGVKLPPGLAAPASSSENKVPGGKAAMPPPSPAPAKESDASDGFAMPRAALPSRRQPFAALSTNATAQPAAAAAAEPHKPLGGFSRLKQPTDVSSLLKAAATAAAAGTLAPPSTSSLSAPSATPSKTPRRKAVAFATSIPLPPSTSRPSSPAHKPILVPSSSSIPAPVLNLNDRFDALSGDAEPALAPLPEPSVAPSAEPSADASLSLPLPLPPLMPAAEEAPSSASSSSSSSSDLASSATTSAPMEAATATDAPLSAEEEELLRLQAEKEELEERLAHLMAEKAFYISKLGAVEDLCRERAGLSFLDIIELSRSNSSSNQGEETEAQAEEVAALPAPQQQQELVPAVEPAPVYAPSPAASGAEAEVEGKGGDGERTAAAAAVAIPCDLVTVWVEASAEGLVSVGITPAAPTPSPSMPAHEAQGEPEAGAGASAGAESCLALAVRVCADETGQAWVTVEWAGTDRAPGPTELASEQEQQRAEDSASVQVEEAKEAAEEAAEEEEAAAAEESSPAQVRAACLCILRKLYFGPGNHDWDIAGAAADDQ